MVLILASTNLVSARVAAGCFAVALFVVLFVAKNVRAGVSTLRFATSFRPLLPLVVIMLMPLICARLYACIALQWLLRGLCIGELWGGGVASFDFHELSSTLMTLHFTRRSPGFIVFLAVVWVLQEYTKLRVLRYIILFIGKIRPDSCSLLIWWSSWVFFSIARGGRWRSCACAFCRGDEQLVFSLRYDSRIWLKQGEPRLHPILLLFV